MNDSATKNATEETFAKITRVTYRIQPVSLPVLIALIVSAFILIASIVVRRQIEDYKIHQKQKQVASLQAQQEEENRRRIEANRLRIEAEKQKDAAARTEQEKSLPEDLRKNTERLKQIQHDRQTLNDIYTREQRLVNLVASENTVSQMLVNEKSLKEKQDKLRSSVLEINNETEKWQKSLSSHEAAKADLEKNGEVASALKKEETAKSAIDEDTTKLNSLGSQKGDLQQQILKINSELATLSNNKMRLETELQKLKAEEPSPNASLGLDQRRNDLLTEMKKYEASPQYQSEPAPGIGDEHELTASLRARQDANPRPESPKTDETDTSSPVSFIQRHLLLVERAQYPPNGAPNPEFEEMMADYAPVVVFHEKGRVDINSVKADRLGYVNRFPQRTFRFNTIASQKLIRVPEFGSNDVLEISFQWGAKIGDGQFRPYFDTWQIIKQNGRFQIISEVSSTDKR